MCVCVDACVRWCVGNGVGGEERDYVCVCVFVRVYVCLCECVRVCMGG